MKQVDGNLTRTLRDALKKCGVPLNQIWLETGVRLRSLQRFRDGHSISLYTADKLAEYFGLILVKKEEGKK